MMVAGLKGVQFRKIAFNTTLYTTHTSDDERFKLKAYRAIWMAEPPSTTPSRVSRSRESSNPYGRPSFDSACFAGSRTRSKLSISCLRFLSFPTNCRICFPFKANFNGLNLIHTYAVAARERTSETRGALHPNRNWKGANMAVCDSPDSREAQINR